MVERSLRNRPSCVQEAVLATVLLVDDDREVLDTLVLTLKRGGYDVVPAESGTRALDLLAGGAVVDLMLTDVVMPDINGFNLARIVRMRHPRMRILFLTGFAEH